MHGGGFKRCYGCGIKRWYGCGIKRCMGLVLRDGMGVVLRDGMGVVLRDCMGGVLIYVYDSAELNYKYVTNLDDITSLVFYNLNSSLAKTQGSLYVHTGKRLIRYYFIKQQVEIT